MALAVDSQEASSLAHRATSETSPQTSSFTNTAGNLLIAAVVATDTAAVTLNAPTYNGVTMTIIGAQVSADGGNSKVALYRLTTPATGANTFSVSGSGGTSHFRLLWALISFSGADTTTPVGTAASATGASGTTASTGNLTNTSGNYLISAAIDGDGNLVAGSGNTLSAATTPADTNTGGNNLGLQYWPASGTTRNMSMTWTPSSSWGTIGVQINAGAGGNTVTPGAGVETLHGLAMTMNFAIGMPDVA